jgi:hypothetical protein
MLLGDTVEAALAKIGVNKHFVQRWLNNQCRCEERKQLLNQLDNWARRIVAGKLDKAEEYLHQIIS